METLRPMDPFGSGQEFRPPEANLSLPAFEKYPCAVHSPGLGLPRGSGCLLHRPQLLGARREPKCSHRAAQLVGLVAQRLPLLRGSGARDPLQRPGRIRKEVANHLPNLSARVGRHFAKLVP